MLLPRLIDFARIAIDFIRWPWQFDFTEGVNLNATMELAAGHNIYRLSNPATFVSAPYTPLFYMLTAPLSWIAGPSLAVGRMISLIATLAIGALLAVAVGKTTKQWAIGILTAGLWLALSPVIVWSTLYTQHMPALALGFGGLMWVMLYREPEGLAFFMGPLLLALAFFTKQSVVDMAAAAGLWLFLSNPRLGIKFGLSLAGMIAIPFFAANLLLNGGLWEHTIANQGGLPANERRFNRLLARLWNEHWPLLSLGAGVTVVAISDFGLRIADWIKRRKITNYELQVTEIQPSSIVHRPSSIVLATIYFLIACASVAVRLGREGVNYNHFIDCLLPACLLFGMGLGWAVQNTGISETRTRLFAALGGGIAGVLLLFQVLSFTDPHNWYLGPWPEPALDAKMRTWSQMVAEAEGEVYSEDGYIALSNGKRLLYDDDFMFMTLARLGRWDQATFVQSLWDRRFSLVILQSGSTRFTPEASQALDASYTLKVEDRLNIYGPKPVPLAPQFKANCTLEGNSESVGYLGYALPPGVAWNGVNKGDILHVTFYWQASQPIQGDYATYVQLLNDKGERVLGQDNPHTAAGKPTNQWAPGELILDSAGLVIPSDLPAGRYTLIGGMYAVLNGNLTGFTASCGSDSPTQGPLTLGTLEVR